jgi:hypothetical protein
VIGKPGYGLFVEAGCNGVPVLYVARGDWPEAPFLVRWLAAKGRVLQVTRAQLESGDLQDAVDSVLALAAPDPPAPTGIEETAAALATALEDR